MRQFYFAKHRQARLETPNYFIITTAAQIKTDSQVETPLIGFQPILSNENFYCENFYTDLNDEFAILFNVLVRLFLFLFHLSFHWDVDIYAQFFTAITTFISFHLFVFSIKNYIY